MAGKLLTVYCLTPETLRILYEEKKTAMNSRCIITAGLGVPLSTGPSTILFDIWFSFYITSNGYVINVLTTYCHV